MTAPCRSGGIQLILGAAVPERRTPRSLTLKMRLAEVCVCGGDVHVGVSMCVSHCMFERSCLCVSVQDPSFGIMQLGTFGQEIRRAYVCSHSVLILRSETQHCGHGQKLCQGLSFCVCEPFETSKISFAGGCRACHSSAANKDGDDIL